MITIIAAVAKNRAIGFKNKLIYWLPNDLKRFKALTTGHTIIMGRNTFLSLPKGALPNRRNIILSKTMWKEERGKWKENTPAAEFISEEQKNIDVDRKSTRLNSSHTDSSRMPSSA